jgi:hypothetical protein
MSPNLGLSRIYERSEGEPSCRTAPKVTSILSQPFQSTAYLDMIYYYPILARRFGSCLSDSFDTWSP